MTENIKPDLFKEYLDKVKVYLFAQDWSHLPQMAGNYFAVSPLARGEYNLNYNLRTEHHHLVFRVNMGSQIDRDDQILYEFNTLKLLEKSVVTPHGYFVDNSKTLIDCGISVIEFLEGEHLGKSKYRFTTKEYARFIETYKVHCHSSHLKQTLADRMHLKNPFVYLRGISWSAMGWVAYQIEHEGIRNEQTWNMLCDYLNLDFIRSLFDPFLKK